MTSADVEAVYGKNFIRILEISANMRFLLANTIPKGLFGNRVT